MLANKQEGIPADAVRECAVKLKMPWWKIGVASIALAYAYVLPHYDGVGDPTDDVILIQFYAPILALVLFVVIAFGCFVFALIRKHLDH